MALRRFRLRAHARPPTGPLLHLHIPKTGGTTVFDAIAARLGGGNFWQVTGETLSAELIAHRARTLQLIGGHLTWAAVEAMPEPPRVLTVIRDPIERALSVYGYFRENRDAGIFDSSSSPLAEEAASNSIDDLILNPRSAFRWAVGPLNVGYLSTTGTFRFEGEFVDSALEIALANLDRCWWIATTATLERDMATLWKQLDWTPPDRIPHHNPTRQRMTRSDLSAVALAELERAVAADLVLYERAQQLAESRFHAAQAR